MNKYLRYSLVVLLVFGLVLVRGFEEKLFYDPFLVYFKTGFSGKALPDYDLTKVSLHILFRYSLNGLLSLGIIGLLFWDLKKVKFSAMVLGMAFLVLLPIYIWMIETDFSIGENLGFYFRRFLIQPIFLMILVPAFYYLEFQKKQAAE